MRRNEIQVPFFVIKGESFGFLEKERRKYDDLVAWASLVFPFGMVWSVKPNKPPCHRIHRNEREKETRRDKEEKGKGIGKSRKS